MRALLLFAIVGVASIGCSRGATESGTATASAASAPKPTASGAKASDAPRDATVLDFLGVNEECTFGHRGILLDLGDATMRARMSAGRLAQPEVEVREHEGASWVS